MCIRDRFLPDHLADVDDQLGEWPNRDALPVLREWGIDYVIVSRLNDDTTFRETTWPAIVDIGALCPVGSFPDAFNYRGFTDTYVFALRPEPGAPCPTPFVPIP